MAIEHLVRKRTVSNKKYIVILLVLFLIYVRHIGSNGLFTILDDEFGYWGNAAYFSGMDWSDTISIIPYYSYGYSLILVPILNILDNPLLIYKAAIVLNGLLLVASYMLCYDISRKLAKGINDSVLLAVSFLIFLYPAYIVYSSIAWSECLLVFIFWLLAWCFVRIKPESSSFLFVIIGILSTYIYTIHQRTIGILIASILTICLMRILNRINIRQFLSMFATIGILIIIHQFIKEDIQTTLWSNNAGNLINDYLHQASKVKSLLTQKGQISFLKVLLGQLYSLGVSSYLMFYIGFFEIIKNAIKLIFDTLRNRNEFVPQNSCLHIFLFLSVILSLAVSVIFMINPNRIDPIVYGRYMDIVAGPIILIGFIFLLENDKISEKFALFTVVVFSVYSYTVSLIIDSYNLSVFCPQHSVGLVFMATKYQTLIPFLLCILGFIFIFKSLNSQRLLMISLLIAGVIFFMTGETVWKLVGPTGQTEEEIVSMVNYIESTNNEIPIYFLWEKRISNEDEEWIKLEGSDRYSPEYFQFLFQERKVNFVSCEELISLSGEKFVITVMPAEQICLSNEYEYTMNALDSYLYYYDK